MGIKWGLGNKEPEYQRFLIMYNVLLVILPTVRQKIFTIYPNAENTKVVQYALREEDQVEAESGASNVSCKS